MLLVLRLERERNFGEGLPLFFYLKIGDEILGFEMFQKFDDNVSGVLMFLANVRAFYLALGEKVVKGNGGRHIFVKFNFANTPHHILFQRYNKRSVILIGNV